METYINVEVFKRKLIDEKSFFPAIVARALEEMPTADVEEVRHAFWEEYWDTDYLMYFHRCSECKNDAPAKRDTYCDQLLTGYCPECGAQMDGGVQE